MDSILEILVTLGYSIEILSACGSALLKSCPGHVDTLNSQITLRFFRAFPWTNLLSKFLCRMTIFGGLFLALMKRKKNEKVIVYHSLDYMPVIALAHRLKRFHLILEVEEIYSDVIGDASRRTKELAYFQKADGYIFPTQALDSLVNTLRKPAVIIHGTYKTEEQVVRPGEKFGDDRIHCVYAGTFDPRKGGAAAAAAAAAFLDERYYIHIIGFGSQKDIECLEKIISESQSKSKCKVTMDGLKLGLDYLEFLQSCSIGLCTQEPQAAFNSTSFPSKILSYLANGLRVVSIRIPVVEQSAVGDMLFYYDKQTPQDIADAIRKIDIKVPYDSRERIKVLCKKSISDFETFLER